ncbi:MULTISPECIES: hypothetical protein [unclassified Nesterenkonia]|uniref:hypothetical protein n=1 Tax=unclassified Nesterenkonia TaxID=2629769 RepID=UPI001482F356|nr:MULTISPECIES: hypothetical protein [unclassified Nesterenkonia]MDS2171259.1 hypothetical protein [Nesterenkonia sp. CL21]
MDLTRRTLFLVSGAGAAAVGLSVGAAPARASDASSSTDPGQGAEGLIRPTAYDEDGRRRNPANALGCPLGRGD